MYEHEQSNIHCIDKTSSCGIPNFSTSLFESFNINESSNRFDSLTDNISSFTRVTSSPKSKTPPHKVNSAYDNILKSKTPPHKVNSAYDNILKVLTINFQSLRA